MLFQRSQHITTVLLLLPQTNAAMSMGFAQMAKRCAAKMVLSHQKIQVCKDELILALSYRIIGLGFVLIANQIIYKSKGV